MLDDQALRDLLNRVKGYKEDREPIITCKPSGAKIILPKQEDSTMYKQSHVEAAAYFLEQHALGTCMSDSELINLFMETMPGLSAQYNFDENDEIYDLLNSQEVIEKSDVIRCVGCWWFVRHSECSDVDGEELCEDCV